LTKTNILFPCPNVPSSPYYFYHYLKGVNPFSVAALEYSSQASRPCPPANTTDPRVSSLDVAGLFPTQPNKSCGYYKKTGWPGTSHNEDECRTKKRDQNNRNQASPQSAHTTKEQYQGKVEECNWHEAFITEALISVENHPKTEGW
jgi:hypothetical protein